MTTQVIVIVCVLLVCLLSIFFLKRKPSKALLAGAKNSSVNDSPNKLASSNSIKSNNIQLDDANLLGNNPEFRYPDYYKSFKLELLNKRTFEVVKDIVKAIRKPNPMLLELTQSTLQAAELYKLIKTDPEMSALILKEVNSPTGTLATPITSINHAINYLGAVKVKDIVIQCCVPSANAQTQKQAAVCKTLWSIGHVASSIAYIMAKHLQEDDPAQMATDTLLAFLGDQVILAAYPESAEIYLNKNLSATGKVYKIQQQFGVNSSMVGHALARQWSLPQALVNKVSQCQILLPREGYEIGLSEQQLTQNLLCYISSRLAEALIYNSCDNLEQLLPLTNDSIIGLELSNIQAAIKSSNGYKINALMNNVQFIKQANETLTKARSVC